MKKTLILAIGLFSSFYAFAEVSGFHGMIVDNIESQKKLHGSVNENLKQTQAEVQKLQKRDNQYVLVENDTKLFNVKTKKELTTFEKEKLRYRASQKAQDKRLANEIKEMDSSF